MVGITDNSSGSLSFELVSRIVCDENGNTCNGISLPISENYDCANGIDPGYNYTIISGQCTWYLVGDYCNAPTSNCDQAAQLIIGTQAYPLVTIYVNMPLGSTVSVTDINGVANNYVVQLISCGPFQNIPGGGVSGGTPCNGIVVPIGFEVDCTVHNDYSFDYAIEGISCNVIGNYCALAANIIGSGLKEKNIQTRFSFEQNETKMLAESFRVFPNPMVNSGQLNFDLSSLKSTVQNIEILDAKLNRVESISKDEISKVMSYNCTNSLIGGIYFVVLHLNNGNILRERIVVLNN